MKKLNDVTLVAVASVRVDRTLKALEYSCKNLKFSCVKIFTHENVDNPLIEKIHVDKMDYENYNKFIVYDLHKHIDTSHVLIVQDDGFIVNPDKWTDDFLKYDYIGALWDLPKDDFSYRDIFGRIIRVGNGGFSLRSKKILSLASELNLEWKQYFGYWNEDGFFTCHNRHIYEIHGCVYSPLEIAAKFSQEHYVEENNGITPFGFHGKHHKYFNLIK